MRQALLLPQLQLQAYRQGALRQFTTCSARLRAFEAGDVVLLREKKSVQDGLLVKLDQSKEISNHRGKLSHSEIIGKSVRQIVQSSKGSEYRVLEPTLAEYVRLTPRLVTPIYPSDANLIVSLLDIHVDTFSSSHDHSPPLEILEAGTGHGALTLHLSRAIHAANPPLAHSPPSPNDEYGAEDAAYLGESVADLHETGMESWKANRRAVVHTVDISAKHSKHARKIVQGFRNGIYARNIEFHVGDVAAWIDSQKAERETEEPFLSHIFLDMPSADHYLEKVASVLRVNGMLAVFNPSITQIGDCVEKIREQRLPFLLDQVIELGAGNIRQWDVRAVKPRNPTPPPKKKAAAALEEDEPKVVPSTTIVGAAIDAQHGQEERDSDLAEDLAKKHEGYVMVCRPQTGVMVVGGGFLGIWRKMQPAQEPRV
ncbi:S-adenosyl-L-methionine-dependent methyltransferase [Sporormia fimetaria CBS 119925]|uniref:tRNA (adenine(58)-N(1))-methyltransferase catalytic subunit TRM61 n=1 Tax=Sporormia fimetaria CBS 119925 TaxID=1340428 RepID=A0A6A6VN54_9PLEO|nr:S-adenosyl-L-methionine-dependent methyltransferase [Sporormia fimetaria CBS 119925]